jgi:hypothetical protein
MYRGSPFPTSVSHRPDGLQIGSVIIVLHAPSDKEVETVDEILGYAAQPGQSFPFGRI